MAHELQPQERGWIDAIGLPHIVRTLGMAVQPAKLALALTAIIVTLAWGWALDLVWTQGGGVGENAIAQYVVSGDIGMPYEEPEGETGLFEVYHKHFKQGILQFFSSVVAPNLSAAVAWSSVLSILRGTMWLVREHFVFFLLFAAGVLLIWSLCGGAICRMSAMEFARDDRPGLRETIEFARQHYFGGFVLAPCVPLAFALVVVALMILGGMILRIPWIGDIVCGLAFFLAILGGFVVSILLIGLIIGGSLFWPTVAAEGSDAFDGFSRGLSYTLSKPWKTFVYGVIMIVFAGICWLVARVFVYAALIVTRGVVAVGTSWFGWWERSVGEGDASVNKLSLLWPMPSTGVLHSAPDWGQLAGLEYFSAFFIGVYVLLVVALLWAFLCSFYFSGSTVLYFLLRRDVDGSELDDVYVEEPAERVEPAQSPPPPASAEAPSPEPPNTGEGARPSESESGSPPEEQGAPPTEGGEPKSRE